MKNMAMAASASERNDKEQPDEPKETPVRAMIDCAQCGAHAEQLHLGCDLCEDCCDCRP